VPRSRKASTTRRALFSSIVFREYLRISRHHLDPLSRAKTHDRVTRRT
jgi:hypothetical protein